MRVTSLGYAALYVETLDQRILIDPIFAETLANGAVLCNPERRLDLERLPAPTALFITAPDFAHFHPPTLEQIPKDIPVFHPEIAGLRKGLEALGFSRISSCTPWQQIELGQVRLIGTPSSDQDAKLGVAIFGEGSFWNMADAEAIPAYGARLAERSGRIDSVATKYQPFERAATSYACGGATRFEKTPVVKWLEAACATRPAFVFPHGCGFCFTGSFAWLNKYVFPFSPENIVELLRRRLGVDRTEVVSPGDIVQIESGKAPVRLTQASPFVSMASSTAQIWEPIDTATLIGLDNSSDQAELETRLDRLLTEHLLPWLESELTNTSSPWRQYRVNGVVWQFVVQAGASKRIERFMECATEPVVIVPGRHPFANSFTHISGRTLLEVLRGAVPGIFLCLTAQIRSYDKAIGLANGRLSAPAISGATGDDPLTYFLRYFNPDHKERQIPQAKLHSSLVDPSEVEVLSRQGVSKAVLAKKVLLSILAINEASRLGITITEADVQTVSGWFRESFGLENEEEMRAWLEQVGLDLNSYLRVMHGFAAVSHAQARYAAEIDSLIGIHEKVASIRKGDR